MAGFHYKALSASGQMQAGVIEAGSVAAAQRSLRSQGLTPVKLVPTGNTGATSVVPVVARKEQPVARPVLSRTVVSDAGEEPKRTGSVKSNDVLRFTSEMAVLLKAGLPLDKAIKVQIDSAPPGPKQQLLQALLDSLKGGKALSSGLEKRPDVFSHFYINMVRSGEASGHLSAVLAELGAYLERAKAVRSTVISALMYPAILAVVATISVMVMLGYVVPEFEALFEDMGEALPMLTRIVIGAGDVVASKGWLLIILGGAAFYGLRRWLATAEGRLWRDSRALRLPVVGSIVRKYEIARFSRTMGTLLHNGVSLLKATDIAVGTVGNGIVRSALLDMAPTIKRGGRVSDALDAAVFSPVAIQMIRVGEESGSLDVMLLELAQVYEGEVEAEVKRGLTLLEPALILGMGGVIAVIIMAILMGILSVNNLAV